MSSSFPTCSQNGVKFFLSTDQEFREHTVFLSEEFPISIYTQNFCYAASDSIPFHWHEEIQVTWVVSGVLETCINGETLQISGNKLLLINKKTLHSSRPVGGDVKTLCINFSPDLFDPRIRDLCILPLLETSAFSHALLLLSPEQLKQMKTFLAWKSGSLQYFSVINFLSRVFEQILTDNSKPKNSGDTRELHLFHTMIDFIHANYKEPLTLTQISASANVSKNRCAELFRKYSNLSPVKYLNEYRLYTAKNLIIHTDRSISEISSDTGYNQLSYFIEQFRIAYGLSPLKYRNKFGQTS